MYSNVIYLLYNGSHYDVFIKKEKDGSVTGIFEISDRITRKDVLLYANDIKRKYFKKARKNPNKKFKCNNDCESIFKNKAEANNHQKSTGHRYDILVSDEDNSNLLFKTS